MRTPIVILIYHRPKLTKDLINSLRKIKPSRLYVIADGPKNRRDQMLCRATRETLTAIDWPCKIFRKFSKTNMGLRNRVVSGLNWVFKKEKQAIILEDDLVFNPTFFRFCEELLKKYAHDDSIISIAGNNFQFEKNPIKTSYYFSKYVHSWGWATWRRAWNLFDNQMKDWPKLKNSGWLYTIFKKKTTALFWKKIFEKAYRNEIDSWAYKWTYTSLLHNKFTIIPNNNLVSNVGYGKTATHTKQKGKNFNLPVKRVTFPLIHPRKIVVNERADLITEKQIYLNPLMRASLVVRSFFGALE